MAKLSVSLMPAFFSTSSSFQRIPFSVWSGQAGIARRRADAAIFFRDEIFGRQLFRFAITPFFADALVQKFRKRLRQPVGQRLGHDGVVVIVVGLEFFDQFLQPMPAGDGKRANVIIRMLDVEC